MAEVIGKVKSGMVVIIVHDDIDNPGEVHIASDLEPAIPVLPDGQPDTARCSKAQLVALAMLRAATAGGAVKIEEAPGA